MRPIFLLLLAAALDVSARRIDSHTVKHGMFPGSLREHSSRHARRAPITRRQDPSASGCGSHSQPTTKAPKTNIFAGLTDDEAAAVTAYLHAQKSLNLTAAADATR